MEETTILEHLDEHPLSLQGCVMPMVNEAQARFIRRRAVRALCNSLSDEERRRDLLFLVIHHIEMSQARWWIHQQQAGEAVLQAILLDYCRQLAALRQRQQSLEEVR